MPSDAIPNEPQIDTEEMIRNIVEWVEIESPTSDGAAVNRMADRVVSDCEDLGLTIERIPGEDGWGDLVIARNHDPQDAQPGILVLAHMDTVHPIGTKSQDNPVRREDDRLYGPGSYDMKAGAYMSLYAYRHLQRLGKDPQLPVTYMFMSEEEVGSPFSRKHIEAEAAKAKYVLVAEPARDGGKVVVARKGVADFVMRATGRPSHAGSRHQDGRSAIKEVARQILEIEDMTDYERGVTFNAGMISGGTGINVVPRECEVHIDMRVMTPEDGEHFTDILLNRKSHDPDVEIEVTGGLNRPPYQMTDGGKALFEFAREACAEHGLDLQYTPITGGGSDGNYSGAMGVPTLDGMGVDGAGAHTLDEYILISSLVPRTKMWIKMLERLE
ncbi:MAG: M20 family metallopeptidase [Pseudomonadota bacterium]